MKVMLSCWQKVHYAKEVEMTEEEYKKFLSNQGDDVTERGNRKMYSLIEGSVTGNDIYESEDEYTTVEVEKV